MKLLRVSVRAWIVLLLLLQRIEQSTQQEACNTTLTSTLRDYQFSASSSYSDDHQPSDAKWGRAGWIAATSDTEQYLQVDFEAIYDVTGLQFTGATSGWYTGSLRILYSTDGYVWTAYKSQLSDADLGEIFDRNATATNVEFDPPITTRYLVINPVSTNGNAALVIELYGCRNDDLDINPSVTHVQNDIETDSTWTLSQSPVVISSHVNISHSATLIVEAGVHVIFTDPLATIEVFGHLQVEGVEGLKVVFSSNSPLLSANSRWKGLQQGSGGNLTLTHAVIRQAEQGVRANADSLRIIDSDIMSCREGVLLLSGSSREVDVINLQPGDFVIRDSSVTHCTDGLVHFGTNETQHVYVTSSKFNYNSNGINIRASTVSSGASAAHLYVNDVHFEANSAYGIYDQTYSLVDIERSNFIGPSQAAYYAHDHSPTDVIPVSVSVRESWFTGFTVAAISISCSQCDDAQYVFQNNRFKLDRENQGIYLRQNRESELLTVDVVNNTLSGLTRDAYTVALRFVNSKRINIENNTFEASKGGVSIQGKNDGIAVTLTGNEFVNIGPARYAINMQHATANITGNTFRQCTSVNLVHLDESPSRPVENVHTFVIAENLFINNTVPDCLINVQPTVTYGSKNKILANRNYWGTQDVHSIKAAICDFFMNTFRARVEMTEFYTSADTASAVPVTVTDADNFRYEFIPELDAIVVGGVITSSSDTSVLTAANNLTVFVNRSIIVESGVTVELTTGRIEFGSGRGVVVRGDVTVGADDTATTVLTSRQAYQLWNGFHYFPSEIHNPSTTETQAVLNLYVTNAHISDCLVFVTPDAPMTIHVTNTTVIDSLTLIYSPSLETDVTALIDSSTISVTFHVVHFLQITSAVNEVKVKFLNTTCTSDYYILMLDASSEMQSFSDITITAFGSKFESAQLMFQVSSCLSHVTLDLQENSFTSSSGRALYLTPASLDVLIHKNRFLQNRGSLQVDFCVDDASISSRDLPQQVTLSANDFTSPDGGIEVHFSSQFSYQPSYQASHHVHYVTIISNRFLYSLNQYRNAIRIGNYNIHRFNVRANTFTDVGGYVLEASYGFRQVAFTDNVIVGSRCYPQCVSFSNQEFGMNPISITGNRFIRNFPSDSIICLHESGLLEDPVFVSGNEFENNTATLLRLYHPYAVIRENFFENSERHFAIEVATHADAYESFVVNASHNYWGTTDVNQIARSIYDKEDDDSKMKIHFRPYLGSRNYSDIEDVDDSSVGMNHEIGGVMNGNVTLTADAGPYTVVANIEVQAEDTLTLTEAVVLKFKENISMTVHGQLNILGSQAHPVIMTPVDPGQTWAGLTVDSDNNTVIEHLLVNNSNNGIYLSGQFELLRDVTSDFSSGYGIHVDLSGHNVTASEFSAANNALDGIYVTSGDLENEAAEFLLDGCTVHSNARSGFSVTAAADVTLRDCIIHSNTWDAVTNDQSEGGSFRLETSVLYENGRSALSLNSDEVHVDSCTIRDHNYGYDSHGTWRTEELVLVSFTRNKWVEMTLSMTNNDLVNNTADGVHVELGFYSRGTVDVIIKNNTFTNGARSLFINDVSRRSTSSFYDRPLNIDISGNYFLNNTQLVSDTSLIEIQDGNNEYVNIENNVFEENTVEHLIVISGPMWYFSSDRGIDINANQMLNNTALKSFIAMANYHPLRLRENVFESGSAPCYLQAPGFNVIYSIDARCNYWGTSDVADVMDRVCGFEKNMDHSLVYYIPHYTDTALSTLSAHLQEDVIIEGFIGGEFTNDVAFSAGSFQSPITITRSILIRDGSTLTVEQGMTLLFAPNRGIYSQGKVLAQGIDDSTGSDDIITMASQTNQPWHGIVLNSLNNETSKLRRVEIKNTEEGIRVLSGDVQLKQLTVDGAARQCLEINGTSQQLFDLEGSRFIECLEVGIYVPASGVIDITNATIESTGIGVKVEAAHGHFSLRNSRIFNMTSAAMDVHYTNTVTAGDLTVTSSMIQNCSSGVRYRTQNYLVGTKVHIESNHFKSIEADALSIELPTRRRWGLHAVDERQIDISMNTFDDVCDITLSTYSRVNLTFHDNTIMYCQCLAKSPQQCLVQVSCDASEFVLNRMCDVSTNVFRNNSDECVVSLVSSPVDVTFDGTFFYNQLLDNDVTSGVVLLESRHFTLYQNIFDNPTSRFDVVAVIDGPDVVNASHNWWGSNDVTSAYERVYDQRCDPGVLLIDLDPILTDPAFDCSDVANCSGRGECVSPNTCRCDAGWTGESCSEFDCGGVNNCHGNGECIGPNSCQCTDGWSGESCSTMTSPTSPFVTMTSPASPFITMTSPASPFVTMTSPVSPFVTMTSPADDSGGEADTGSGLSTTCPVFVIITVCTALFLHLYRH